MGSVNIRTGLTSGGMMGLSPWNGNYNLYAVSAINLGNNFIGKLEIVSSLNSLNIPYHLYHYNYANCTGKYNPKVYMGAVQTASTYWIYDTQTGQNNGLPNMAGGSEKSGSLHF